MQTTKTLPKVLSLFSLVMITVTSVDSIRNLPATALLGSSLISIFIFAAIVFLIPTALVSAELSSALPMQGGVYIWVRNAFGKRWGFAAIWFQWINNVIWYPSFLSFIAGTFAYLISPELSKNPYYIFCVILIVFWSVTVINLFGMRLSARFSIFCGLGGLIIPMALIIALGLIWIVSKRPVQIEVNWHNWLPDFKNINSLVLFISVILSFCGMEITTAYAHEVKNPQRDYPKALLISTCIIIVTMALGSLSIAMVIPHDKINLVAGVMAAFENFFSVYHLKFMIPVIAGMILLGGLGGVSNWIIAPCKGLIVAAEDANFPRWMTKNNAYGAPVAILLFQGLVTSIIALIFVFIPKVNSCYWILTALSSELYMLMYILIFVAAVYLRFKQPTLYRPYRIPFGNIGIIIVSSLGVISALLTIAVGFFAPDGIVFGTSRSYASLIGGGLLLFSLPALFFKPINKPVK